MKVAWVEDGRIRVIRDYPNPKPGDGEALIRVLYAGICGTDIELLRGYYSFRGVPGHEFVGIVEDAPSPELLGARVVGEINIVCGACQLCLSGLSNHCSRRTVLGISGKDGAFAEYLTLPIRNLHRVPEEVSDEEAVFVEPLAAAYEILEQVRIGPDQETLVLGDGRLGALIGQVLNSEGRRVTLAGRHPEKLSLLRGLGVPCLHVNDLPQESRFDIVVDATGSEGGLTAALRHVRPRGTVILKSTVARRSQVDLSKIVVDEINIVGSRCGPFPRALKALREGRVNVRRLISAIYPLEDVALAMKAAEEPSTFKVLLRPAR